MMRIIDTWDAIRQLPQLLSQAATEIRLTREQLQKEIKATNVLGEKAFLAILRELETISRKLEEN